MSLKPARRLSGYEPSLLGYEIYHVGRPRPVLISFAEADKRRLTLQCLVREELPERQETLARFVNDPTLRHLNAFSYHLHPGVILFYTLEIPPSKLDLLLTLTLKDVTFDVQLVEDVLDFENPSHRPSIYVDH